MILAIYRLLQPLLERLFGLIVVIFEIVSKRSPDLQAKSGKLIQTYRMRHPRGIAAYLEVDFESLKGKRPIWVHAASGEYEYAKPLVKALSERGDVVFVTYFSPTYRGAIEKDPAVTASCPLPLDNAEELRDLMKRLQPRCLLIARTDTWPNLIFEASRKRIPILLFSATFHALSGRVGGLASYLTRATYPFLTAAHGVTEEDCQLLESFGVRHTIPAGDTRYDQVLARLTNAKPLAPGLRSHLHEEVLVAGSVWPEDIENILPGLIQEIDGRKNFSAILVPHEISAGLIENLSSRVRARGLKVSTYSQFESASQFSQFSQFSSLKPPPGSGNGQNEARFEEKIDVLIVDRVGILAELYQLGRLAFVGGSYRKTVHSVMEPLAAGCITLVGPKHLNNREAIEFQTERIANFPYPPVVCAANAEEFHEKLHLVLASFLESTEPSPDTRTSIREMVRHRGGATKKALEWVEGLGSN